MCYRASDWEALSDGMLPTALSPKTLRNETNSDVNTDYDSFSKILFIRNCKY